MRIALSSYTGYGAWFILRLLSEGHKVDYFLSQPEYANVLGGIVPAPFLPNKEHSRNSHARFPDYSRYDVSIFDLTGRERQAEYSAGLCPTIGDGAFNCAVENDRMFGIQVMEEAGIDVPPYEKFTDISAAKAFIRKSGKRYVYKPDGGQEQDTATTYVADDADDMSMYLDKVNAITKGAPFILQEFITGTEVSVEGWFNGEDFYLLNCTLEEKKFMNKGKGPNTGCAGNLIFNFGSAEPAVYKHGLKKMRKYLSSIGYTGMIDLNTIATPQGLYGLEWTPRFGYDASAALLQLYAGDFGEMLQRIATGQVPEQSWRAEFCAGVRLSIPPYPSEIRGYHPDGVPIQGIEPEDFLATFMYDLELKKDEMVTAGHSGFICTPMGKGNTIAEAFDECDARIKRIKLPNAQIRTDIEESTRKRYQTLDRDGWLSA
jgi:phosphoribosylamine--glycine ligase